MTKKKGEMPDEKTENDRYAICNAVSGRNSSDKSSCRRWVQEENGSWYYLNQAGEKAKETWIGNYYVDENGVWIEGKTQAKNEWISSGGRWWYRHSDGGYTRSGWEQINGTWYYFDGAGWMETGWVNVEEPGTT